jgi:hypothetical protein
MVRQILPNNNEKCYRIFFPKIFLDLNKAIALFVWTYQQNQQPSSNIFLSQQTNEECFQHNKAAKRTVCMFTHGNFYLKYLFL